MTSKEWKDNNPGMVDKGNIRDYADLLHLVILNNLENINAELIQMKIPQGQRLVKLNNIVKRQISLLKNSKLLSDLRYIKNKTDKTTNKSEQ